MKKKDKIKNLIDKEVLIGNITVENQDIVLMVDSDLVQKQYIKGKDGSLSSLTQRRFNKMIDDLEDEDYLNDEEEFGENLVEFEIANKEYLEEIDDDTYISDFNLCKYINLSKYKSKNEKQFINKFIIAYEKIRLAMPELPAENILYLLDGGFNIEELEGERAFVIDNVIFYDKEALYDNDNDLVHELLHVFSDNEGMIGFFDASEKRRGINEGFTELYAQKVIGNRYSHDIYTATAETLEIINNKDYSDAYFNSDIDELYEEDIDKKDIDILFFMLDSKMNYDFMNIKNDIGYNAKKKLCNIAFEKIEKNILNGMYEEPQELMEKMDEIRDIISSEKSNDEKLELQFDLEFRNMYRKELSMFMDYYIDTNNKTKKINTNECKYYYNDKKRQYLGSFKWQNESYNIYLVDGMIKYFLKTDFLNEKDEASVKKEINEINKIDKIDEIEVSFILVNKFDSIFGIHSFIDYSIEEMLDNKRNRAELSLKDVDIDKMITQMKERVNYSDCNESDEQICDILNNIGSSLHFYQEKYKTMDASNLLNNMKNFSVKLEESIDGAAALYKLSDKTLVINKEYIDEATDSEKLQVIKHEIGHIISTKVDFDDKGYEKAQTGFSKDSKCMGINEGFTELLALPGGEDNDRVGYTINLYISSLLNLIIKKDLIKEYSLSNYSAIFEEIEDKDELYRMMLLLDMYTNFTFYDTSLPNEKGEYEDNNVYAMREKADLYDINFVSQIEMSMLNVIKTQFENELKEGTFNIDRVKEITSTYDKLFIGSKDIDGLNLLDYQIDMKDLAVVEEQSKNYLEEVNIIAELDDDEFNQIMQEIIKENDDEETHEEYLYE